MQRNVLDLVKEIKNKTELYVKIDTNGFYPEILKDVLPFSDFISIDIKTALNENYGRVVGLPEIKDLGKKIKRSLCILKEWKKPKEARTTIVPGLIDSEKDIKSIARDIKDIRFNTYTLQQFRAQTTLIDPEFENLPILERDKILELGKVAKKELLDVEIRIATQENGFEYIE